MGLQRTQRAAPPIAQPVQRHAGDQALKALQVFAGASARAQLHERGLRPQDVCAIPAAAGGPKGLILHPLDRYLFGDWLARSPQPVHLLGASIGAWRMATACLSQPVAELERFAQAYVHQRYEHAPGRPPTAAAVTRGLRAGLQEIFGGREAEVLGHARYRLHVFTSRGRHVLAREGALRTPLGYLGAYLSNALARPLLGHWLERVVFSDPRAALPLPLSDVRSQRVALSPANFLDALQASCSIPFWLRAVQDISGAPRGAYWDGGITDYHLHLNYAALDGLVLYPHFQREVIPGWLDKGLKRRHRASPMLDKLVLLAPHPDWVAKLPRGKLPDRADFKHFGDDIAGRAKAWGAALAAAEQLRDEFHELQARTSIAAEVL